MGDGLISFRNFTATDLALWLASICYCNCHGAMEFFREGWGDIEAIARSSPTEQIVAGNDLSGIVTRVLLFGLACIRSSRTNAEATVILR